MRNPLRQIAVAEFGGGNWHDEPLSLFSRAYGVDNGAFVQRSPVESPDLRNMDFFQRDLAKRNGSALIDTSSAAHAANETILLSFYFGGNEYQVGDESMYRKASGGSWTRMKVSGGGSDFGWTGTPTKASVVFGDGYAFVGSDGVGDNIQVVEASSNNLQPPMKNANDYTDQQTQSPVAGGITGTWTTATPFLIWFQNRLCMTTGDSVLEYTDIDQPWDLAGGGYWQFQDDIVAMATFVPRGGNELLERLFVWTKSGLQILSGFDANDVPFHMEGAGVPLSHRAVAATENWLVYPTTAQTIEAVNATSFIDVGRRMFNGDGTTGPLDNLSPSNANHATLGFSFYDRKKKQWSYWGPDGASRATVSTAWVLDFSRGEPVIGEPQDSYERRISCLWWLIKEPATNAWFISVHQRVGSVVGVLATGATYTVDSGDNDLGSIAIEDYWDTPDFDAGDPSIVTNWRRLAPLFRESGNHNVDVYRYLDLSPYPTGAAIAFSQVNANTTVWGQSTWGGGTWGGGGVVQNASWLEVVSRSLRLRFQNQNSNEPWRLAGMVLEFQTGSRQD